jgi:malonyl-CoA decarboxylase
MSTKKNTRGRGDSRPVSSWLERLRSSLGLRNGADAGRRRAAAAPLDRAKRLATALLSERGEASGAVVARELHDALRALSPDDRLGFQRFLATGFQPDTKALRAAAEIYLSGSTAETAALLAQAADPTALGTLAAHEYGARRHERTGRHAQGARRIPARPVLKLLDGDLKHLFASWFNRGFLELRRIDWQSPAAVLDKLIASRQCTRFWVGTICGAGLRPTGAASPFSTPRCRTIR